MSDRRTEAAATLARLGLDADALAAGQVPEARLHQLVAGPEAARLVHALGDVAEPAIATLLVDLESHAADRAVRKEIRRALYRFRQRGVSVPEPPSTPVRSVLPIGAAEASAWLTGFGAAGDRIMWLERPLVEGGALLVYAHVHEPKGLLDVSIAETGRKRLRELKARVTAELAVKLVPADWHVVDALLVEASERTASGEFRRDYVRARPRITADPPRPPVEPVSARVAAPTSAEATALAAVSDTLLDEPEFKGWGPDPEEARVFVTELGSLRDSPIVLSPMQQEDRVREILRRATGTLAPLAVLARRLDGTGYVLAETGRTDVARRALAVARLLREEPDAASELPFVAKFVHRAIGGYLAADETRRDEDRRGSLVVTPGEFLKDRSSSRPGRTRG